MFPAVCDLLMAVASLSLSHGGVTADSTRDSGIYSHNHLQNQEEFAPYFRSDQHSCLMNGSLPCPPWSYCDSDGTCKCPEIPTHVLECNGFEKGNAPSVLDCNCITYNEALNQTEVGLCLYNCGKYKNKTLLDVVYHLLPPNTSDWNDVMCGRFKRAGTLCGRCNEEDGFYPRVYSFDMTCVQCTNGLSNWWKYVLSVYLPLTLFYLAILCFKINIHTSQLQGYIIYSQFISIPALSRNVYLTTQNKPMLLHLFKFIGSLHGIWNLDFFRMYHTDICLQTDTLSTLALELATAVYPILLMVITFMMISLYYMNFKLTIILWKPFRAFFSLFQGNWDIRTSTVDSLTTFLFLTYIKFLNVCLDFLVPVRVYHFVTPEHHVNYTLRLYYDATVPYFRDAHLPYAITAIVVMFFFVITPTLIIIVYPIKMCHKCFHILPRRGQLFLHTFMDSFQGCYKDGTERGTQDCRWFSSVLLIFRFALIAIYAYTLTSMYFPYAAMVLVITAMIAIVADPFKAHQSHLSSIITNFILFIAAFYVCVAGIDMSEVKNDVEAIYVLYSLLVLIGVLPLLYIAVLILCWIFSHRKFGLDLIRRVNAWRRGFNQLM